MTPSDKRGELREKLATIEHERWADWQKYMLDKCTHINDMGEVVFNSVTQVENWRRQIRLPYDELTEQERASDMEQVDRYWPLIEQEIAEARIDELTKMRGWDSNLPITKVHINSRIRELEALRTKEKEK